MKPKRRSRPRQKRSKSGPTPIVVTGHKGSVTLQRASRQALRTIAAFEKIQVSDLVLKIDREDQHDNLSAAIRLFILNYLRRLA
jgi:predicted DNA-binding ribbon-helix-helix protein